MTLAIIFCAILVAAGISLSYVNWLLGECRIAAVLAISSVVVLGLVLMVIVKT